MPLNLIINIAIIAFAFVTISYAGYLNAHNILLKHKYAKLLHYWRSNLKPGDQVMVTGYKQRRTVVAITPTIVKTMGGTAQLSGNHINNIYPL
jgi:hypothetical protein